jgi:flavin reductase like protein
VSIHSEHPFAAAAGDRSPLRRLRGRLVAPVSVWAAGSGRTRAGWTVSSFVLADGEPGEVVGLLDEDSDLADRLTAGADAGFTVNVLGWRDRQLAEAFAGLAPAPGGVFRLGSWSDSDWGPVLQGTAGWLGARLRPGPIEHSGWALLLRGVVEHVEPAPVPADGLLAHVRGRYRAVGGTAERAAGEGDGLD